MSWGGGLRYLIDENGERLENIEELLGQENQPYESKEYKSQIGLQGYIFSFLYHHLHLKIAVLNFICAFLLAVVLLGISVLLAKRFTKLLGISFYLVFLFSPWIIYFAKKLFWVEFTWFLPGLFSLLLIQEKKRKKWYIPCIFASILLKCLCGYEYVTAVILLVMSFLWIDWIQDKEKRKENGKIMIQVLITCILALCTALAIHSFVRGEGNLIEGIKSIYKKDITRRTLNLPGSNQFDESIYATSIHAGVLQTIKLYFKWYTDILIGIPGNLFLGFVALPILILLYRTIKKKKESQLDNHMFIVFFLTSISWFVFGKSHSFIHTHINFVLWYFGFIEMCVYLILKWLIEIGMIMKRKVEKSWKF